MRLATFTIFVTAVFSFSSTRAQDQKDTLSYSLGSIQVNAIRSTISPVDVPLSLSIKSRSLQEMSGSAATSLASITGDLPGLWVSNRQNNALGERITIRGIGWRAAFGVRGVQVVLDGIPLTTADGQSITNIIDPSMIKRIELLRGPAASYWGNSSGGILYLSTKAEYGEQNNFNLRTQGGSYRSKDLDFSYSDQFGNHKITAFSSYNFDGGYRNYSSSKLFRSGMKGSYQFEDNSSLQYIGALLWMPQAHHPSGLSAEQIEENPRQAVNSFVNADAGKQVTQGQLGLKYDRNMSVGLLNVSGYGTYRDLVNPLPFGIITVDRLAGGLRGSLEKFIGDFTINTGGELKFQRDDREEFENDEGNRGTVTVNQLEKVLNQAIFITSNYTVGSFDILGSLRYDRITFSSDSAANTQTGERTFQALSPGFGLSYQIGNSTIFANLSTSFEAPTTTELVNRPDGGNGFNPDLKPEQTIGMEFGSRGTAGNGFEYDVTLYQLWIQDLLFPYQLETDGPTFYRNQGETRHHGIEFAASLRASPTVSVGATYTLTEANFIEAQTIDGISLEGNAVPGVANHRLSSSITWSPGDFWMQLRGEYISSYPVDNLNTAQNDEYIVADAKISYQAEFSETGVTVGPFINVNNILNERYNGSVVVNAFGGRYYEPAPGRNWQAGISIRF